METSGARVTTEKHWAYTGTSGFRRALTRVSHGRKSLLLSQRATEIICTSKAAMINLQYFSVLNSREE